MRHGEKIRSEIPSIYIDMYFIFYIPIYYKRLSFNLIHKLLYPHFSVSNTNAIWESDVSPFILIQYSWIRFDRFSVLKISKRFDRPRKSKARKYHWTVPIKRISQCLMHGVSKIRFKMFKECVYSCVDKLLSTNYT